MGAVFGRDRYDTYHVMSHIMNMRAILGAQTNSSIHGGRIAGTDTRNLPVSTARICRHIGTLLAAADRGQQGCNVVASCSLLVFRVVSAPGTTYPAAPASSGIADQPLPLHRKR